MIEQLFDAVSSWLLVPASLSVFPVFLCYPIVTLIAPETRGGVMLALFLNTYGWTSLCRFVYSIFGRYAAVYHAAHYRYFLWIPWRPVWRRVRRVLAWHAEMFKQGHMATGGFASLPDRLCLVWRPGLIFLGRQRAAGVTIQQPAGVEDERHVAMIAGPGFSKSTHAISWVCLDPGNGFIIDTKGEIASITMDRKGQGAPGVIGQGKTVRALDPMNQLKGRPSAKFNVYDLFYFVQKRSGDDAVVRYAVKAADGLVRRTGNETNPFFSGMSREFIGGALLDIMENEPRENQHLGRLYDLMCNGLPEACENENEDPFRAWLWRMMNCTRFGGAAVASANALSGAGEETMGNILVSIREHLQWLKLPEMRRVCESGCVEDGTDVHLQDLRLGSLVLYVCALATDIRGPLSSWFRLLTTLALYLFEDLQTEPRPAHPTLFLLDEFPALGVIDSIQVAAGLMRSMFVRLVIIAQDKGQLAIYQNPEAFLGSAITMFMGGGHVETNQYIERAAGFKTVRRKIEGGGFDGKSRYELREEPVIRAETAKRLMGRGIIITLRPNDRPLLTRVARYFEYLPVYLYTPVRKETLIRRLTRSFFKLLIPGGHVAAKPLTKPGFGPVITDSEDIHHGDSSVSDGCTQNAIHHAEIQ